MNNDNIVQTMPSVEEMVTQKYSLRNWLQFYENVWTRQAIAHAVDVQCDRIRKAENPEMPVESNGEVVGVKHRLESRKLKLQDALDVLKGTQMLLAIPEAELEKAIFGEEALAVDEDMLPKQPEATEEGEEVAQLKVVKEEGIEVNGVKYKKDDLIPQTEFKAKAEDAPAEELSELDKFLEQGDVIVA